MERKPHAAKDGADGSAEAMRNAETLLQETQVCADFIDQSLFAGLVPHVDDACLNTLAVGRRSDPKHSSHSGASKLNTTLGQHKTALDILAGVFTDEGIGQCAHEDDGQDQEAPAVSAHTTVVDDFPELAIDKVNVLSKRNEARTLATGVMHCTLQRLQTERRGKKLLESPSKTAASGELRDDVGEDRLSQLLMLVYPNRCASEPAFVVDTMRRARLENREKELIEALMQHIPREVGRCSKGNENEEAAPASAFLLLSALQMQLAQLKHWHALAQSKAEDEAHSYGALIASTCESLTNLLEPMPLGKLSLQKPWECAALDEISRVLFELMSRDAKLPPGMSLSKRLRDDHVQMLYIALAVQRGSIHDLLVALNRLMSGEDTDELVQVPDQVMKLLKRFSSIHVQCSFALENLLSPATQSCRETRSNTSRPSEAVHELHLRWEMNIQKFPRVIPSDECLEDPPLPAPPALHQHPPPSSLSTRHSTLRTRRQRRRLTVGDRVIAPPDIETNPVLRPGDVGTIISDDRGHMPYRVSGPNGPRQFWFREGHLLPYDDGQPGADSGNGDSDRNAEQDQNPRATGERLPRQDVTFVDSATQVTSFNPEDTVASAAERVERGGDDNTARLEHDHRHALSEAIRAAVRTEAVAVSDDGRFLFICGASIPGIVKVGTGLSSLETGPTDAGKVYAYNAAVGPIEAASTERSQSMVSLAVCQNQVLVFTRQRGSLHVACEALDWDSLKFADPTKTCTFRLPVDFGFFHEQVKPLLSSVNVAVTGNGRRGAVDVEWQENVAASKQDPGSLLEKQMLEWVGSGKSWLQHTGQWYFEVQVQEPSGLCVGFGCRAVYTNSTINRMPCFMFDLANATKLCLAEDGVDLVETAFGMPCKRGDVIGCALAVDEEADVFRVEFSLNGSWAAPFGLAFEGKLTSARSQFRPVVTLEKPAQGNVPRCALSLGGIRELEDEAAMGEGEFKFSPPSGAYTPVAWSTGVPCAVAKVATGTDGEGEAKVEHEVGGAGQVVDYRLDRSLGALPPMTYCEGKVYYVWETEALLPPSQRGDVEGANGVGKELVVDVIDPLQECSRLHRLRFYAGRDGFPRQFPSLSNILAFKLFTNGEELVIIHDSFPETKARETLPLHPQRTVGTLSLQKKRMENWHGVWPFDATTEMKRKRVEVGGTGVGYLSSNSAALSSSTWTPVHGFVYSRSHNALWTWDAAGNTCRMTRNVGLVPLEPRPQPVVEPRMGRLALCTFILGAVTKISMPFALGKPTEVSAQEDIPFVHRSSASFRQMLTLMSSLRKQVLEDSARVHGLLSLLELILVTVQCGSNKESAESGGDLDKCLSELMQACLDTMDAFPYNFPKSTAIHELCNRILVEGLPAFLPDLKSMVKLVQERLVDTPFGLNNSVFLSALLRAMGKHVVAEEDFRDNFKAVSPVLPEILQITTAASVFQLDEQGQGVGSAIGMDISLGIGERRIVTEEETKSEKNSLLHSLQRHEVEINTTGTYLAEVGSSCSVALAGLVLNGCTYVTKLLSTQDAVDADMIRIEENERLEQALENLMHLFAMTVDKSNEVFSKAIDTLDGGADSSRVEATVQRSLAGRVLPCFSSWLDFLMRSRTGQRACTLALLNADPSFFNITSLLQNIVKFVSACPGSDTAVSSYAWLQRSVVTHVVESGHPYSVVGHGLKLVNVPEAAYITVSFDEQSETADSADFVRFLRVRPDGSTVVEPSADVIPPHARFGEERYSGRQWPGVHGVPALLIPSTQCAVSFERESNEPPKWGYRCTIRGHVAEHHKVSCTPWQTHLLELSSDLVSTIIFATIGTRNHMDEEEAALVRWVQNPIMSGGLKAGTGARKSYERLLRNDSVTRFSRAASNSGKRRRSRRSRSRQRARSISVAVSEGETLLVKLTKVAAPTEGDAGAVFRKLRALRVPLDQGFYTHRLATCLFAALVKVNGIEKELALLAQTPAALPSKRVQRMWMQAQHVRKWADGLVVNKQVKQHIEASTTAGSALRKRLMKTLAQQPSPSDPEEFLYAALTELVADRVRFLLLELQPPILRKRSLRMSHRDAAFARWHRLRSHFCPRTHQLLAEGDRWLATVTVAKALEKLRVHYGAAPKRERLRAESQPPSPERPRRSRRSVRSASNANELRSAFYPAPRVQRRRERMSGGLRRASEAAYGMDVAHAEYEQSLSDSAVSFVECALPVDSEHLEQCLVARDERALLRIAGFDLANALMAMTNAQEGQWEARFVFEKVVRATGGAIRGNSGLHGLSFFSDGESGVALIDDPHMCIAEKMEAHYLTDLTGCKVELREAVARRYEFLLCSLSGFLKTTLKRPRPSKRVGRMARLMMKLIAMDYVEADYDMLANSGVTNTLRTALLAPAASAKLNITTVAWKLLQLLIKRCICDGGRGFASGNSLQQLLLDVLVLMLKRSLLNVFGFHRTMPEWTWQAPSQRQAQGEEASFFEAAELRLDNEVIGVQSDPLAFTTDGSVWFSLFMHKETFRHGVLFSLGNPSATGVPDESGVAKYMPVPLPYSDGADHKQKMPWAFIQLCIDKHRRIVVRLGSYCGKVVSAVTDVQCGFNEQVDVRVSFSHQSSLVVSVRTDSGTVVEKFPGLIDHLTSAKEVSKWNAARPGTMTLKVGTRVYVKSGLFEGVVGTLESRAGTTTWLVVLEIQPFTLTYAFAPEELQVVLPGSSLPPVDYPSLLLKMKELDFFDMMRRPDETTLTKQRRFSHFSLGSDNDDESEEERVGERRNGSAASLHAPLYIGNARSSALGVSLRFLHVASTATKDTANVSTAKQVFHSMRTEPTDDHGGVIQGEDGNALHEPEAVIGPAVLVLSLCHTVCQSPVGRARLTAPYPLELLLSSSLAVRGPLELRVSCTRLMRTMMADISVTTASACALRVYKQMRVDMPDLYEGRSVEACEKEEDMASGLPFIALLAREVETATRLEAKGGLKRLSSDAFTMAAEYVELLRHLCKRPAWAAALGTWVLDGVQRSSLTALSVLGGVYEGCRVGGHACAGEEEVYVIAKAWVKPEKEKEAVDVTKDIRVEVSSEVAQTAANVLVDDDKFWQSNGHTPHWIRLTCPTTVELSSVRMLGCGSDAYAPADVTVSVGPRKDKLREIKQLTLPSNDAWVTLAKVGLQDGDTVFQLNIQSNHKRGCDSRICAFQVLGTKQRTQLPPPSLVVARPAVDDASKTLEVVEAYKLRPKPLKPPMALLDALSEEQNHRLVAALMRASSSPDLDVRVRCLKVMESLSRHPRLGALLQDTALTMLMEKQAELSRPKELRIVREAFAWKVDKDTARKWRVDVEEQIVTFQPAGRVHRAVSLDTSAMVRGKHVWELELVEDIASDETSLFGLTALPFFVAERSELNILAPSEDLWLIRSFNGHRYHKGNSTNWAGAEALRIHPKDVVKCEYDADIGVFSVAVNQGPMVKVFDKIDAPWGLRPCVASYGNRSPVSIKVRALKSTQPVRKSSGKDFPVDAWCSSIISSHDDLLVEARYAHVLALCYDQALAVKVESDRLLPVVKRPPRVEEEMPLDVDESDGEEDKEEDRERQQQTQHQQGLADESQPMVQKVAALFEVKDEKTSGTTEEASDAPGQTDDRVGPMVAQLLNTSLFTARADVLQECASCILENLYARQLSQTLDAFFQEGLDSIDRRLPADVMSPDSLQHTLHLAYRACGEQERLAAMDELTSKSAVVAEWLCQNDSHVDLLTRVCIDLLRRVGARLLEEVKTVSWEAEKAREARSRLEDAASATASMSTTTSLSGRGSAVKGLSKPQRAFKVGAQVEARFMGHRRWYPGRISGVNPDGTYQINYHDSDQETHVPQAYIRARRGLSAALPLELVVGDEVDARYRGKAKWYPGRVSSVNTDGTFDIQYHDGDFEANVPLRLIRMSASNPVGRHAQSPSVSPPPTQRQQPVLEDFSKSDEPGSVLLVADRFKGALPEDGKPDSAQVSIINHPVEADGVVKTIKLRLADQPSGGSDRWEVLLFERAGESSTFFVVSSTPEQPHARSYIYLDPNCLTDQVAEVETKLVVLQGQYIGVMNSAGRLNVSYTPGKKKSCESWALKPVEVFYLMPRSVPNPFVGGPYRTKLWHGRAGWCATVQISSNGVATAHSLQLAKRIDDLLMSRPGPCAIPVAAMVKHCCWLLLLLLKQDKMCISRLLGFPGLIQALRRLCEHGLFLLNLDRDVGKPEDRSLWDRVLHLIAHICSCAQQDHERSGARMPTAQANEVIRLQRCFEVKANSLNRMRHQTLRLRAKGLKEQAATSLHLQRLLRCLVLLDALTRKDFVVNDHEPAKSWTEIDCSLPVAQAPIIRYEISGSRVFISEVVQPQQTSVRTQNQSQKHSVFQLQQGDELVEVNHLPVRRVLADQDLLRLALGCQRKRPSAADVESEHTLLERLSSNVETVVINGVMLHTTDSWLDDGVDDTPPPNTGTEQVTLKFRRQTGGPAESRLAESTAAITYKGVRRSSAQSHSWLDAMMTASELSQALSTRSLPPARYLSALFAASRQQLHAVDMPSPEPTEDDHSDYLSAASGDDLSTNLQISVPGAIALKLCWDSRSCVTDGSLVVSSQGQNYHGLDGMPPNVSIVSGSEIHVRLSEPEPTGGLDMAVDNGGDGPWRMAGLQNRAGAFMRLGTAAFCRTVLYCGRKSSDIVGWTNEHGRCGPHGGPQCPDCADYIARNHCGYQMVIGAAAKAKTNGVMSGRKPRALKWVDDLMYCSKKCNPKSKIPCVNCCKFLSVLIRTEGHTNIPKRLPAHFSSTRAYEHFLSNIVCVGIKLRVSPTHPSDLRNQIGTVIAAERAKPCVLRFALDNRKHTLKVATFAYRDLLLCSVQEIGGIDARGETDTDQTLEKDLSMAASFRPPPYPSSASASSGRLLSERRMAVAALDTRGIGRDEDIADDVHPDRGRQAGSNVEQFLEASDFERESLYAEYMLRYCAVGSKVRCVRTYENIEEGDIGIVQAIDAPDDLPCQALWQSNKSLYWLPWSNLSLNIRQPSFPTPRSHNKDPQTAETLPHDEDWSKICFDKAVLGPDVELFNDSRTATRMRADGWGTQKLNHVVDVKHSALKLVFRVDENASNHLLLGAIGQPFTSSDGAYKRSMMERCAWCLRADGSIYADGKQIHSPETPVRIVTGDMITLCIDISNPNRRSITFIRNGAVLGEAKGLPSRVTPAVSFGGSFQRVSIAFAQAGLTGASPFNAIPGWGFHLRVEPVFSAVRSCAAEGEAEEEEQFKAFVDMHASWTRRQDDWCIAYINAVVQSMDVPVDDLLEMSFFDVHSLDEESSKDGSRLHPLLERLVVDRAEGSGMKSAASSDEVDLASIAQRYEVLRAFNSAVVRGIGLLDLSGWRTKGSPGFALSECCSLLLDKFKLMIWQDALSVTRTQLHQFEVVLDFGKAMSRSNVADVNARHTVFAQAFRTMNSIPAKILRAHGKLYNATLRGMGSHDDGGPYRQSFSQYCKELQSIPGVGLFLPCSNRRNQIHINQDRWLPNPSARSPLQLEMFEFLGKLMGIAIRNKEYLDLRLPSLLWKYLVQQIPSIEDLRAVDLLTVTHIEERTAFFAAADEVIVDTDASFAVYSLDGKQRNLLPNGRLRAVTQENVEQWASLTTQFKLHEFDIQIEAIQRGLAAIVPQKLLLLFTWQELEMMVCGHCHTDIELLKAKTVYVECSESEPHIRYFWNVLNSFTEEQRSDYIKFVWGRARLPMRSEPWEQPHKITPFTPPTPAPGKPPIKLDECLPFAHTCYFTIDLPRYSSEDILRKKLLFAIENCPEIDGDQTDIGLRSAAMGFHIVSDDESSGEGDPEDDMELLSPVGLGQGDEPFPNLNLSGVEAISEDIDPLDANLYPYRFSLLSTHSQSDGSSDDNSSDSTDDDSESIDNFLEVDSMYIS